MPNEIERRSLLSKLSVGASAVVAVAATKAASASDGVISTDPTMVTTNINLPEGEAVIAYMITLLRLTKTQQDGDLWNDVMKVVRQNAINRHNEKANLVLRENAVDFLEAKYKTLSSITKDSGNFFLAFRKFYNTLTLEQKVAADTYFKESSSTPL